MLQCIPLAPFRLKCYTTAGVTQDTTALVRIGLIKRLESSAHAFRLSVERLLRFVELSADAERAGGYLQGRDSGRRDPLQLSLTALLARPLPAHTDRERLRADLSLDCVLLRQLRDIASSERDPKAEQLERLLQGLPNSPRVVFTQYAETAEHLFSRLRKSRVAILHGSRAALGSGPTSRRAVLERFAPVAMGASHPAAHERIDTLICTDVLSEGLDLQDAKYCVSYDLPWNPVRLMQRIGRIDRMRSPHELVHSWYFTPHHTVEELLQLLLRLRRKIRTIEGSIGPDAAVIADQHRRRVTRPISARCNGVVWQSLESAAGPAPADIGVGATLVARIRTRRTHAGVALLGLRADGFGWWEAIPLVDDSSTHPKWSNRRIARLLLALHRDGLVAESGEELHEAVLRALARRTRTAALQRTAGPCHAAARQIWLRLSQVRGGASPQMCATAERVLRRLHDGLPVAQERALGALLRSSASADLQAVLTQIERVTDRRQVRAGTARIVAVLLIEGRGPG